MRIPARITTVAIVLFLIFEFLALVFNHRLSREIERDASAINIAGRQRMLSQKMTKVLLQMQLIQNSSIDQNDLIEELRNAYRLFDESLLGFSTGRDVEDNEGRRVRLAALQNEEAIRLVRSAIDIWRPFSTKVQAVLYANDKTLPSILPDTAKYAETYNLQLLDLMNQLTTRLQDRAHVQANNIRVFQTTAFVLGMLSLLTAFLLVSLRKRQHASLKQLIEQRGDELDAALREKELLLQTLDQQMLYSVTDIDGHIVSVNDYFCRVSGYSQEELLGKSHQIFKSDQHDSEFWENMWLTLKSGKSWRGEICNRARSGNLFWTDTVIAPFLDSEGRIKNYVSLRADITDKKTAEQALESANQIAQEKVHLLQALHEAESWYRFIIESSDDAIIGKDLDGRIKSWNPAAETIFGYSTKEAIGRSIRMLVPADRQNEETVFVDRVNRGETIHHFETQRLRKDGRLIDVLVSLAPISDLSGKIIGGSKIARDISEHKRLEKSSREAKQNAEAANKAKSAFLSTMSHEIRTPLNAIIGMVYLLNRTTLSHDQKEQVESIQMASRNLLALINDILDISKIEAGGVTLNNHPFSLNALLDELRMMFTVMADEKRVCLDISPLSSDVPNVVEGDETRLRQMLVNLINNALKFTEHGGVSVNIVEKHLDAAKGQTMMHFSVTDTGIGIPKEAHAQLFKPFTQVNSNAGPKIAGTGLGLSIVRELAERMGGRVGLESIPGHGSTFWFEVPLKISNENPRYLGYATVRPLQILVAEDDEQQRQVLMEMAAHFGWSVDGVADGHAAVTRVLEHVKQQRPIDCIILDWRMPRMDGLEALAQLKMKLNDDLMPAIIMVTAYDQYALRQDAGCNLPDSILNKPVSSSSLFNSVNKAVFAHGMDYDHVLNATLIEGEQHRWLPGVAVLVVDDSQMNLDVCRHILEAEGATVSLCESGEQALTMIKNVPKAFDIVLMDIQMPNMDGCETTRRIRHDLGIADLPVIALTAGAMASDREMALEAGMNDFLTKPLDPPKLVRILRKYIENNHGAPLPIVPRAKAIGEESGWPEIPGIDVTRVAHNLNGDIEFFIEISRVFLDEYHDVPSQINGLLQSEAYEQASALLHRLRGSAGNIGAMDLYQAAESLENVIERRPEELEQSLKTYQATHQDLVKRLNDWLSGLPDSCSPEQTGLTCDTAQIKPLLPELEKLLSEHRFQAGKLSKDIETLIANTDLANSYKKVADLVRKLDYEAALAALGEFQNKINTEF
ncbi:MAG: PAS domain S-box protein [Gammaproteobacteria bacterium]